MSMIPSPINKKNDSSGRNRGLYVSTVALLASLALIFSYVEVIIPYNAGIPGVKLGIANIVTVTAIYKLSPWHGAAVNAIRIAVAGLLFNGLFGAVYAFAGATLSFIVMILLKKTGKIQCGRSEYGGGRLPQHGAAHYCIFSCSGSADVLLFSSSSFFRNGCRHSHWNCRINDSSPAFPI